MKQNITPTDFMIQAMGAGFRVNAFNSNYAVGVENSLPKTLNEEVRNREVNLTRQTKGSSVGEIVREGKRWLGMIPKSRDGGIEWSEYRAGGSSFVLIRKFGVEAEFIRVLSRLLPEYIEQQTRAHELDSFFDVKVEEEIAQDAEIVRLMEEIATSQIRQNELWSERTRRSQELRKEKQGTRRAFHFVVNDREI
jgi:hypothetical protein